jgi:SAM-dependent methyltransferase
MQEPDFRAVAAQLRHPSGDDGNKTAEYMSINNKFMIERAIVHLGLHDHDLVLETGYGGGMHIPYLMQQGQHITYKGVDISTTMLETAQINNRATEGNLEFLCLEVQDGWVPMPFEDSFFDKVFTVNTLYFWDNPHAQAAELYRVLRPKGTCIIAFAPRSFMEQLPFAQYDFNLYEPNEVATMMQQVGFEVVQTIQEKEWVPGMKGDGLQRDLVFMSLTKK